MANQGPQRAADEPYGEASFRKSTIPSFPLSFPAQGRPSKAARLDADIVFTGFLLIPGRCTHFSLAFTKRSGATPLLGRRLRAGRTFASPRKLARGFGVESFWLL
jgi:hypothetical protein